MLGGAFIIVRGSNSVGVMEHWELVMMMMMMMMKKQMRRFCPKFVLVASCRGPSGGSKMGMCISFVSQHTFW